MTSGLAVRLPHAVVSRWRMVARALAAGLLVSSVVVLVLQVDVTGTDGGVRSCGSAFDVIAGRVDWQQWRRADIAESAPTELVRTVGCPSAVNGRTGLAGGLAIGGAVLLGAALGRRPAIGAAGSASSRSGLARLANWATAAGALLSVAGLVGLGVLLANPNSALFLYASRGAVFLIGLALLQPTLALLVVGLALRAWLRSRPTGGDR